MLGDVVFVHCSRTRSSARLPALFFFFFFLEHRTGASWAGARFYFWGGGLVQFSSANWHFDHCAPVWVERQNHSQAFSLIINYPKATWEQEKHLPRSPQHDWMRGCVCVCFFYFLEFQPVLIPPECTDPHHPKPRQPNDTSRSWVRGRRPLLLFFAVLHSFYFALPQRQSDEVSRPVFSVVVQDEMRADAVCFRQNRVKLIQTNKDKVNHKNGFTPCNTAMTSAILNVTIIILSVSFLCWPDT